jgi:subfamily B ATP-binding cassette protein MsbA
MKDFSRLFPFVKPHLPRLAFLLLLLVLAGLAEVLTTGLAIPLFDVVLSPGKTPEVSALQRVEFIENYLALLPGTVMTQLAAALLILTLIKGLALYNSNYGMGRVGQRVVMDLRNRLYSHVVGQSMGFFTMHSTGRLMSRMNSDVEQVQEAVSTMLAELFRESVLLLALIAWVIFIDWRLAALALMIAPAALILTLTMGRRIRRASLTSRESVASLSDLLQQSISGMRIVKAFGMEPHEESRFQKSSLALFSANLRAARILFLNSPVMELLGVACSIPLLYYAHQRINEGTLTLGLFSGSLFALFRMYDPIRKLSRIHIGFQRSFASASRISELLETHVEIHDRPDARIFEEFRKEIEFRNVHFDYEEATGRIKVLEDINLRVGKNQIVAIVGSSGAGKTTLVSLIPRFYDVTEGAILIDGSDIREFTQRSLRNQIAIVTQDTFLFNDTIHNNIAYGDPGASEERIVQAAKAAFAHEFISSLPKAYETSIGERGERLSGGEKQRISIARAILRNAPLLVLDEATSALDSESEKLVQQALANLMQDRTTFVIAHRLSTIRNADIIIVLDKRRIGEIGNHESLMKKDGLYRRFFRIQMEESLATGAGTVVSP